VVLAQTYFGFAKGPVFVAHQAQHRQQLRLGELSLTEARALGRQNLPGHLQRHASKRQESDFGHRPSCPIRNLVDPLQRKLCRGCQQSPTLIEMPASVDSKSLIQTRFGCNLQKTQGEGRHPKIERFRPGRKVYLC
jgi:hypothetical protein